VEVAFASKKLRQLCEVAASAELALGAERARELRARLSDLEAAHAADDIPVGSPNLTVEENRSTFTLQLVPGTALVFNALGTGSRPPQKLRDVKRVILERIEGSNE